MKVSLAQVGTIKKDLDESQLQEVVTEIVIGALRGTNVHLNLFQYPSCPRLWREPVATQPSFSMPMHYDNVVNLLFLFLSLFFSFIFKEAKQSFRCMTDNN